MTPSSPLLLYFECRDEISFSAFFFSFLTIIALSFSLQWTAGDVQDGSKAEQSEQLIAIA